MESSNILIVNWNIEWRRRSNRQGAELHARIMSLDPDIVCITEGHTDFLEGDYDAIFSDADYGYPISPGRRKVALWSKRPWHRIDTVGSMDMPPGRFVAGVTETVLGPLHCIGVCIPWSHAHVTSGRRDAKAWEEHLRYLDGLADYLRGLEVRRLVVLGDFNQAIPRTRAPIRAYDRLREALPADVSIATSGPVPEIGRPAVDHVGISPDLRAYGLKGLSNYTGDGRRLSDHFGLAISISDANRQ